MKVALLGSALDESDLAIERGTKTKDHARLLLRFDVARIQRRAHIQSDEDLVYLHAVLGYRDFNHLCHRHAATQMEGQSSATACGQWLPPARHGGHGLEHLARWFVGELLEPHVQGIGAGLRG